MASSHSCGLSHKGCTDGESLEFKADQGQAWNAGVCCIKPSKQLSDLVGGFVTEQCMHQEVSHIFSVYGTTHIGIFCQNSPPSCGLCLQASWSDDSELHVPAYALHRHQLLLIIWPTSDLLNNLLFITHHHVPK